MSVQHILGKPQYLEGVGYIYPVRVKDYDEFQECANILYFSKKHFITDEYPLLDMVLVGLEQLGMKREDIIEKLTSLFKLVLRTDNIYFVMDELDYGFVIDEHNVINNQNYDQVREIIMKQNLMFEPKIYKNKLVQKWAEKVIETRIKNSIPITFEDKIDLVHVFTGIPYDILGEQTIYQLEKDFNRICRIKGFDAHMFFQSPEINKIPHFASSIDMFKNPYDDLFVGEDKLHKLNTTIKS